MLKDKSNGFEVPPVKEELVELLEKKKQVILYGPPGTGKTYNTKIIALSLIDAAHQSTGLVEYDQLPDTGKEEIIETPDNPLWIKIASFTKGLTAVDPYELPSMGAYYSMPYGGAKNIALVWLEYPKTALSSFTVHLRKEKEDAKYPRGILTGITNFKRNGWGGYPSFMVKNDQDAENAMKLIEYAYSNL